MANPDKQGMRAYLAPALVTIRATFPAYRSDLIWMIVTSGIAVLLETAGLGLIYLLIVDLTGAGNGAKFPAALVDSALNTPLSVTIASVALLSAGVRIKYHVIRRTSKVSYLAGRHAGALAAKAARPLIQAEPALRDAPRRQLRSLLSVLMRDIPFSCGVTAGGLSLLIVHALQAAMLSLVLLWVSPALTVALMVIAVLAVSLMKRSFGAVVEVTEQRKQNTGGIRKELDGLAGALADPAVDADSFAADVDQLMHSGRAHDHLHLRLAQRRILQTGPLVMEYVYPVAIICITLMYIYGGEMAPHISQVALYFLLFRQFAAAANVMANVLMSTSRHHLHLSAFTELLNGRKLPDSGLKNQENDDDE